MTRDQFIAIAIEKASIGASEADTGFFTDVADLMAAEALGGFAEVIANDSARAHLLQPTDPVELNLDGNGAVDLTTGAGAALLTSHLHLGRVTDNQGNQLDWICHFADFQQPHVSPFGKYTLQGKKIYAMAPGQVANADGTFPPAESPLKVRANITPTAAQIPLELEDEATRFFAALLLASREKAGMKKSGTAAGRGEV